MWVWSEVFWSKLSTFYIRSSWPRQWQGKHFVPASFFGSDPQCGGTLSKRARRRIFVLWRWSHPIIWNCLVTYAAHSLTVSYRKREVSHIFFWHGSASKIYLLMENLFTLLASENITVQDQQNYFSMESLLLLRVLNLFLTVGAPTRTSIPKLTKPLLIGWVWDEEPLFLLLTSLSKLLQDSYLPSSAANASSIIQINSDLEGKKLNRATEDQSLPICWKGAKPFKSLQDAKYYFKPLILSFKKSKILQLQLPPEAYLIVSVSNFLNYKLHFFTFRFRKQMKS